MKILIALTLLLSSVVSGAEVFLQRYVTANGTPIVYIQNNTGRQIYCWVIYDNGYGYFDFYVNAYSQSRHYREPVGYYEWQCR